LLPTRSISRSVGLATAQFAHQTAGPPTSSRKTVPSICGFETAQAPLRGAGERALLVTEKLEAISDGGMAAQFHPNERSLRPCGSLWMARAINSFPVPVSPKIKNCRIRSATLVRQRNDIDDRV